MPDRPRAPLRLYTIPPSAPFLTTLAKAVLNGDLPHPCAPKPSPLTLPLATLYLPTRRAVRGLRDAFLDATGGKAALLPSIRALGDPDEDAAIIFGEGDGAQGFGVTEAAGAPAIAPLARRLALMRLVRAWSDTLSRAEHADPTIEGRDPRAITPAQASYLAADLARLMDFIESEGADLSAVRDLVPEEHAEHWGRTVEFLTIVTEHWPQYLRDQGLVSPVTRRNVLMTFEGARLLSHPPECPVIAAGSTGTIPATAKLLKIIALLPNGAVVLPGLDLTMDEESWASLREHPEHPQAGMAELLAKLGVTRDEVAYVPGSEPELAARARLTFVSEVQRPAGETDRWQVFLQEHGQGAQASFWGLRSALAGIELIEAPTAHDEAETIALILREAIETPGKTAALITPDRTLARRVAARLRSYDFAIDDSAGEPVARTVPGAFLDLLLSAAAADFAAPELMAMLKHPLARLDRSAAAMRTAARILERGAFRDLYVGQGLGGVAAALDATLNGSKRRRLSLSEAQHGVAMRLVEDLKSAYAPLTGLVANGVRHAPSRLAEAHAATAEALARDETGSPSRLWAGDAGEALSVLFAELIASGPELKLAAADYPAFYRSLLSGRVSRPRRPTHPRLSIWGPLEARLQQPDVVILGSLNEGVWPHPQEASPWLSRPMAAALGLPPPERRIGLAAHDFAQALGARQVYLSRALKVEGVPTVKSRWLQRLTALVDAAGLKATLAPKRPWVAWARTRDEVSAFAPALPPRPCPPVEARPRKLSVTRIERWIANPYEIFARDILRLEKLKPLGAELDPASRGTIIHQILSEFARRHPASLPANIEAELTAIADGQFASLGGSPRVEAFWRPAFQRFARWFAATEPARRALVASTNTELDGSIEIGTGGAFSLTARADRIDVASSGGLTIYDYKTGKPPLPKHVDGLFAPQLPLEAAIAEAGGFAGLGPRTVDDLRYIQASGRGDGGEETPAAPSAPGELARHAVAKLEALVAYFARPESAYEVKRRPGQSFTNLYRYDDYEHLARIKEWLTQETDEDWR